jgi:hypothetical protein
MSTAPASALIICAATISGWLQDGAGVRSGDFGEILVADYIDYLLGY